MTLEATPRTDTGALIAAPIAQAPPPPPDFTSVFVAAEEDDAEGADQPVTDDLTSIGGSSSRSPPAVEAVDEIHPRVSGLEHQETGNEENAGVVNSPGPTTQEQSPAPSTTPPPPTVKPSPRPEPSTELIIPDDVPMWPLGPSTLANAELFWRPLQRCPRPHPRPCPCCTTGNPRNPGRTCT